MHQYYQGGSKQGLLFIITFCGTTTFLQEIGCVHWNWEWQTNSNIANKMQIEIEYTEHMFYLLDFKMENPKHAPIL